MTSTIEHRVVTDAQSLGELFLKRVEATPGSEAFRRPAAGGWQSFTWDQTAAIVRKWAAGLLALGVDPGQRVAIACSTRLDWIWADLAIMCAGAATTTVYPSTPADDVAYILNDSESRVVFAEDSAQLAKLLEVREEMPALRHVVLLDDFHAADGGFVITSDELARRGAALLVDDPGLIERTVWAVEPTDLATIIYTSGTTGRPKGVRLSQGSWMYQAQAIDALGIMRSDDLEFLWLPLAHAFGKVLLTVQFRLGFPCAVDGRVEKIVENLGELQPTWVACVPRIFEKLYGGIQAAQVKEGGPKLRIFRWAEGVAADVGAARREGRSPSLLQNVQFQLADRLVLSKIRARLGGRIRFFITGSAALSTDIGSWFDNAGIVILEAYGLTEVCAGFSCNTLDRNEIGTVGAPFKGSKIKIAEDGEILMQGPGVMQGYHNLPEQTAEVLKDGWFHTGDIGELTPGGHIKITDRKKDLLKTSGGKYVAPQSIEVKFKAACPYASAIVVHGNNRKFVSALVTLDEPSITGWAESNGISGDYAAIVSHPKTQQMVQGQIDQVNEQVPPWERVRKFAILDRDLSIDKGEITPSMKVKRKVVEEHYQDILDSFYA
jgi:long-chain acyl-CoA synthetase